MPEATLYTDLEDHRLRQGQDGYEHIIRGQVIGVPQTPNGLVIALSTPGVPKFGDAHPNILGIQCALVEADYLERSPTKVGITATYRRLTSSERLRSAAGGDPGTWQNVPPQIEIGTRIVEKITNKDIDGNEITVRHVYGAQERTVEQSGFVSVSVPQTYVRYMRWENVSPLDKSKLFGGKINSTPVFGDPEHYWICLGIDGPSEDGGQTYLVTYEFLRNDDTWDPTVVFIDPETDRPPVGLVEGEGIKTVRVSGEIEFRDLGI